MPRSWRPPRGIEVLGVVEAWSAREPDCGGRKPPDEAKEQKEMTPMVGVDHEAFNDDADIGGVYGNQI
jgi:hypothetical protein